jgi:uncharacterized protein involved in response to NO
MSCGPATSTDHAGNPDGWWNILADEGFRLFFPLAAIYAAIWPLLWVLAFEFDLPLASTVPPSFWHAHEMLVGAFGAALIGFLTTAAPEWTDSPPLRGRALWGLAALWATGRLIGLFGWDALGLLGAVADIAWLTVLLIYLVRLSWQKQTERLIAFAFWLAVLLMAVIGVRVTFMTGNFELASKSLQLAGLSYLGLLGLALGRITVPVTNLILDPTEKTSPFRPHPGRLHLAAGLTFVAMLGETAGLSPAVSGYLLIGAGAAFMDRVAEAFIGKSAFQSEILMLAGSSSLAGAGLMLAGAARLGASSAEVTGWHVALMGGLGLGVYAVLCIAGKLHSGQPLGQSPSVRIGAVLLVLAVALRIAPDFGLNVPGPYHGLSAICWGCAFLIWVGGFWRSVITK